MRDIWQEAFDAEMERSNDPMLANRAADDAVADYLSAQEDSLYDHWRETEAYRD